MNSCRAGKETDSSNVLGGKVRIGKITTTIVAIVILLNGCSGIKSGNSADSSSLLAYAYSSDLNARVLEIIQRNPLLLVVQHNDGSRIETAAKSYQGEEHGLLWWKHRWQEQTRFTILIRPNSMNGQSVLEVYATTFHRKNEKFPWQIFTTPKNEQRATEVMRIILKELGAGNVG